MGVMRKKLQSGSFFYSHTSYNLQKAEFSIRSGRCDVGVEWAIADLFQANLTLIIKISELVLHDKLVYLIWCPYIIYDHHFQSPDSLNFFNNFCILGPIFCRI